MFEDSEALQSKAQKAYARIKGQLEGRRLADFAPDVEDHSDVAERVGRMEDSESLEQPSPLRYVPSSASDHTEPFQQHLRTTTPAEALRLLSMCPGNQRSTEALIDGLHAERREQAANAHRWRLRCESVQQELFWTRVALLCHAAALLAWVVLR